jgi:hypothetical protein
MESAENLVARSIHKAPKLRQIISFSCYLIFLIALCWACFMHPVAGDFDRYIYEALVRGQYQDIQTVYAIVKHENPRAEASTVLDSPGHLAQLEPLYAIRPLYLRPISVIARFGVPVQSTINLVSVLSLFGIGVVLFFWTRRPGYSALVMATPAIAGLGRIGTPDALSSLVVLSSMWALLRQRWFAGVLLLLVSPWCRTDNILIVLLLLAWLAATGKLPLPYFATLALVAVASVLFINHFSGNYGWGVLFQYSFIGGRYPADIVPNFSLLDYARVLVRGFQGVGGQEMALWTLTGIAAYRWLPKAFAARSVLVLIAIAALARFLLFPTPEDRYFAWAYLIVGATFIEAIDNSRFSPASR